jgi:hypothetical protein
MKPELPFTLLDAPDALARCNGWAEEVCRDLLALQDGSVSHDELDRKYCASSTRCYGSSVLHEHDASLVRACADDLVGLFDEPGHALDAAFEMPRRVALFNQSADAAEKPAQACIGIGYGCV